MRRRRLIALVLCLGLLNVLPAYAKVTPIDPESEPETTLLEEEAAKLAALQSAAFPSLLSDISPDDTTVLHAIFRSSGPEFGLLDIAASTTRPVDPAILTYPPLTEIRWRDANTAIYPALSEDGAAITPILVSLDKTTGSLVTDTLTLPGFPISLAPNASRLLVVVPVGPSELSAGAERTTTRSPFDVAFKAESYGRTVPARFAYERADAQAWLAAAFDEPAQMQASSVELVLAVFDLASQQLIPLEPLATNTVPMGWAWTPDGGKLALARMTVDTETQEETGPGGRPGLRLASLAVQDSLGNLAPADNPFLQGSVIDVFDIAAGTYGPNALRAAESGAGGLFTGVAWNSDGSSLLATLNRPARLSGRQYPIYMQPESVFMQLYGADMQLQGTFAHPTINAPFVTQPLFVSPDEVIIHSIVGLSSRMVYYNRVSGEVRQIPIPEGSYFQFASTRQSRQLVFTLSSFQQPHELFRVGWDGSALAQLTYANEELKALNQVRADFVTFRLRSGAVRSGFLVQPAAAAFPPRNVPIVVWQEGGPTSPMAQYWGGSVESPQNLLPNFGIAVLHVPLPGRLGYGPQFLNDLANNRNFGQIDIDEQAEITRQLIARGYTSSAKLGIAGCSYGGYFVSQSLTRYPNLYAAGNGQCSLLDLFSEFQYGYTDYISYLEGRTPLTDPAEIAADAPINRAARVRSPLLLFHGTNDFLPVGIAKNFHDQIEQNRVPVELLTFAGERHGLASPVSQYVAGQAQLQWFREQLGD